MSEWFDFAKAQKEIWAKISKCDDADLPPFVIAERDGEPLFILMCPQHVERGKGHALQWAFDGAALCRRGMATDALAFITDGYCLRPNKFKEGDDWEKQYDEIRERYDDLRGAFLDGCPFVGEALTTLHCDANLKMTIGHAEYVVEGKKVFWRERPDFNFNTEDGKLEGIVPDALRQIMQLPTIFEMVDLQQTAEAIWADEPLSQEELREKQLYHSGRAIRRILHEKDYLILECVKWKREEGYGALLDNMMKKYEEVADIYDFDKMKTKSEFLDRFTSEN